MEAGLYKIPVSMFFYISHGHLCPPTDTFSFTQTIHNQHLNHNGT